MSITSILTNAEAISARVSIQKLSSDIAKATSHISSGSRLTSAADDPTSISLYNTSKAALSGARGFQQNVQEGISVLQTVDSYAGQFMDKMLAARDVAVRYANSPLMDTATATALAAEYASILADATAMSTGVEYNDKLIMGDTLASDATLMVIQTGALATDDYDITYEGTDTAIIGGSWAQATLASVADATTAIGELDTSIADWAGNMASIGSKINHLQSKLSELQSVEVNLTSVVSAVGDADMAYEITEYTRMQVIANAATSILAQANMQPASIVNALLG